MPSPILHRLAGVYTHATNKMVQDEYAHIGNILILELKVDDSKKEFVLGGLDGRNLSDVLFDGNSLNVCCSCGKFEFKGHLCKHIFFVFQNEGVLHLRIFFTDGRKI